MELPDHFCPFPGVPDPAGFHLQFQLIALCRDLPIGHAWKGYGDAVSEIDTRKGLSHNAAHPEFSSIAQGQNPARVGLHGGDTPGPHPEIFQP
jgi:hypothetical protein